MIRARGLAGLTGLLCCGVLAAACSNPSPHESTGTTNSSTTHHTGTTVTSTTSVPPSTRAGGSSTTTTGIGPCPQVSASLGQSQGAAGTIIGTIDVTSTGKTCTMEGYPSLTRFNAAGITMTANIVHGLTVNLSGPASEPPALVTLAAGQQAAFDFEYSDVPTGEESCPSSTSLSVTTPGAVSPSPHFPVTMAPCDDETIAVSPVYAVSG